MLSKKIHLWLSVPVGLVISLICLTGAALVFEREITASANRHLYEVEAPKGAETLPIQELMAKVAEQLPDSLKLSSIEVPKDAGAAWLLKFDGAGKSQLSVDPYTGEIKGWVKSLPFFQTMRKLHRWLMDVPPSKGDKTVGKVVVGVSTLAMIVILVTGVAIWWPKSRKMLQNRLKVSTSKGKWRFLYDSHVSLGIYAAVFLLLMALTGPTWSFQWYRAGFNALFGVSTSSSGKSTTGKGEKTSASTSVINFEAWNVAVSALRETCPEDGSLLVSNGKVIILEKDARNGDKVSFDPQNGEIKGVKVHDESRLPMAMKMKGLIYSLHTGLWGGIVTQVLYFIAAFIGGILPLTGYYLWIKRLMRKKRVR